MASMEFPHQTYLAICLLAGNQIIMIVFANHSNFPREH